MSRVAPLRCTALRLLGLGLAAWLSACGSEDTTSPTRASARGASQPGATGAAAPDRPLPGAPATAAADRRRRSSPSASPPPASQGAGGGVVEAEADEDPRDRLSAALASAFGEPTACLSDATRDRLGDALSVNVTVRVLPSGRVVSATVSGAGLADEDVDCLTSHAEGLRIPGPVEGAPRTVAARVTYEVEDSRVTHTERVGPGPRTYGPGTLNPDSTLPAAMTETDRPAGFVEPGSTLPAQVEPGPAPGYVGPGSTLPARAD